MMPEIVIGGALALSAFAFSFTGFGFALVAVPLLALVLPLQAAVGIQFPFLFCLVFYHAWRFGRVLSWRSVWPLIVGSLLTMPTGLLSLTLFPEQIMKRFLAIIIVLVVLINRGGIAERLGRRISASSWWGLFLGGISGWLNVTYGTGGPPAVIYIMASTKDPVAAKGFLGLFFAFASVVTAVLYFVGGVLTVPGIVHSLWYTPLVALGAVLGACFFRRTDARQYRLAVDALLLTTGILLWFRS